MPDPGASTPDLAQATTDLETALATFQRALRTNALPRAGGPLFAALRQWRTQEARTQQVPPYIIASDAVLRAIEQARPAELGQLQAVRGIGASKAERYGAGILAVVAAAQKSAEPVAA